MTNNSIIENILNKTIQEISNNKKEKSLFNSFYDNLLRSGEISGTHLTPKQRHLIHQTWESENKVDKAQAKSPLYSSYGTTAPPLEKEKAKNERNLGKGWFNLQPIRLDDTLKRDLKMIRMRNYLDAKRFYKNPDKFGTILHRGTVIAGRNESKAQKMTRREQKQTLFEEIFSDKKVKDYSKRKYLEIQKEKSNKRKTFRKPLRSKGWK
mmetsp:Transcript_18740/g.19497  ORF Transcript_18740/g.19497 Transcript_18740/m.19497 type:complete len:209 (+) Transcript_18740:22-648(+)